MQAFCFHQYNGLMRIHIFSPFVFINILGATFIFNISLGEFFFLDFCHKFLT